MHGEELHDVQKPVLPEPAIPLAPAQAGRLAQVLAGALHDEPRFTYVAPDETVRPTIVRRIVSKAIDASRLYGEIYTTATVRGGALWIRPGEQLWPLLQQARTAGPNEIGPAGLRRLIKLGRFVERVRQRLATQPHWYLLFLGTEAGCAPAVCHTLIAPVLARADVNRFPCYVETFRESEMQSLHGHGFRIEGGARIPGGPEFWAMMRAPS
jgi:hypothetical protein